MAIQIMLILYPLLLYTLASARQTSWVESKCGDVVIPFPFYMKASYHCSEDHPCSQVGDWFEIECRDNQTPFLKFETLEVKEIDIEKNTITVMNPIDRCLTNASLLSLSWSPFFYSQTNRLIFFACNSLSVYLSEGSESGVCLCSRESTGDSGGGFGNTCSPKYCCQTRFPMFFSNWNVSTVRVKARDANLPCDFLLMVDSDWLSKSALNNFSLVLESIEGLSSVPAVLEWGIPFISASISVLPNVKHCYDYTVYTLSGIGLLRRLCKCPLGFKGNQYTGGGCIGDDSGERKTQALSRFITALTAGLGSIFLLIVGWWIYKIIKKRRMKKLKEKYFQQNGGLLLQEKLSSSPEFNVHITELFILEDLEKATDHFNADRVLGKGGQGTVYKGMLADGKIVAVKKQKVQGNIEDFINEIVILAQINHKNVVKLFGCCLEAKFPLLVYEFIPNGTLSYHLHEEKEELPMTLDMRLRIAIEVAGALFYLHSAASQPIYHRDIKSTNILLCEKYGAKVADFGASRLVPNIEATHITTRVQGTFGYLDPEYYYTSKLTEKSDVYSYGVVLVELLTGQKAVSSIGPDGYARSLASYFTTCMDKNCIFDILDENVMKEGDREHIMVIANLAKRCLSMNGKDRPTMKEVAVELVGVQTLRNESKDRLDRGGINLVESDTYSPWDILKRSASVNLPLSNSTTSSSNVLSLLYPTYP